MTKEKIKWNACEKSKIQMRQFGECFDKMDFVQA